MSVESIRGFPAERIARDKLSAMLNVFFETGRNERTLIVAHRSNGEPITREFDLVSKDKQIIGEIKSDKYTLKAHATTRLPRMLYACRYLELASAKRKLLVITDKQMYEVLKRDLDGIIDKQIEIIYVDIYT